MIFKPAKCLFVTVASPCAQRFPIKLLFWFYQQIQQTRLTGWECVDVPEKKKTNKIIFFLKLKDSQMWNAWISISSCLPASVFSRQESSVWPGISKNGYLVWATCTTEHYIRMRQWHKSCYMFWRKKKEREKIKKKEKYIYKFLHISLVTHACCKEGKLFAFIIETCWSCHYLL